MITSSKDILFIVIAICIAAFTFFSCWGLYYMVGVLRNFFKISKDARNILNKIEGVIDTIREKILSSTSYLMIIGEMVKKILEIVANMRGENGFEFPFRKKKAKKKSEEKDDEDEEKKKKETEE